MITTERTVKLVRKLIDLTASGVMTWKPVRASKSPLDTDNAIGYEGFDGFAQFKLTRERRKVGALEAAASMSYLLGGDSATTRVVYNLTVLPGSRGGEFVGEFRFPDVENMRELYQAVTHQSAKVDSLLGHYLTE